MWLIIATATETCPDGYTITRQIPTFYLNKEVQGFLTQEGAIQVAKEIIDPMGKMVVYVHACPVNFCG